MKNITEAIEFIEASGGPEECAEVRKQVVQALIDGEAETIVSLTWKAGFLAGHHLGSSEKKITYGGKLSKRDSDLIKDMFINKLKIIDLIKKYVINRTNVKRVIYEKTNLYNQINGTDFIYRINEKNIPIRDRVNANGND